MSDEENDYESADVGFRNGSIRLEEIPPVYYSGQTINGAVIFDLRRPLKFTALTIQFLGEANVFWNEYESLTINRQEMEREIKYQGHEEYFNYTETLVGGYGTSELPRTHQSFPFRYRIPFTAPSSFKGERGSVTYTIIARMVYPDTSQEELKKEITVVAPLDLNEGNPSIKEPIDMEFEEVYSCCCSSSPVSIRIRLPVAGYCPGQAIPVAIEVKNKSSVEITKMIFEIISRELYRSRQPPSEYVIPEKVLVKTKSGPVLANCKSNFTCNVMVPDMLPPYLENCNIIDVGYFFRITIKLSGCNDELQDETEICLGLVPVKETLQAEYRHPMADSLPSGPIPVNDGTIEPTMPPAIPPGFSASNTSLNRSQQNISQSAAYQNRPPPYPGNIPYPAGTKYPGFAGSTNSINRSQHNIPQNSSHLDAPPPYPGNAPYPVSAPYPTENKTPMPGPNPYNIGFVTPERLPQPGPIPGMHAPYPGNVMPPPNPPYPLGNTPPGVNNIPAPHSQGFAPTAPPAVD